MTKIPASLRRARLSCEDLAECLGDISEDLRVTLYDLGARDISAAWVHLSEQERGELAYAASDEERRCADMVAAIL
jgi:hypothetical protein